MSRGHDTPFAHSLPDRPPSEWEPLAVHLERVAELSAAFAAPFGASAWAKAAGQWHDVGKYAAAFQQYLQRTAELDHDDPHRLELRGTVNHSAAGAVHADKQLDMRGRLLAYCIAGHHGGMPNTVAADGEREGSGLIKRLAAPPDTVPDALERAPHQVLRSPDLSSVPITVSQDAPGGAAFQVAFFTRMLFACLVDADFLATEAFYDRQKEAMRADMPPSIAALAQRLEEHLRKLQGNADDRPVNHHRNAVLQACRDAAAHAPGLFALTVPTGGGKTLNSLAFALHHAHAHALRRVIVAIPFTSIIEQNAMVYRRALGDLGGHVLEHHSNLDPARQTNETARNRLAAENWDAPLVVTTNVQLLESLFACRPGRCRKLHRIAGSVIVLDEAQALPPQLLAPTLAALHELVTNYGCSIVLCTATQPALEQRNEFPIGLEKPRPIIPEAKRHVLFSALKRVETEHAGALDDETLIEQLADESQVLCIVNTRAHAAALFHALAERLGETQNVLRRNGASVPRVETCLHLSANMCPRHRSAVLRLIRRRLERGDPCRVISTQLVEAGVDVDFPVVYRAMAGLDAIAQAAGRCNREGRLDGLGRVVIFEADKRERRMPSFVRAAVDDAREVLVNHADNPLAPEAQHEYFRLHYWKRGGEGGRGWDHPPGANRDDPGVLACFADGGQTLQFRQAADRYRLISDDQWPVLVPYGPRGRALIDQLRHMPDAPGRAFNRQLQRLIVAIYQPIADELANNRALLPPDQTHGRYVLGNAMAYDRRVGLNPDVAGFDPESLMS